MLRQFVRAIRQMGLRKSVPVMVYTRMRDRLEAQYAKVPANQSREGTGSVVEARQTRRGALVSLERGSVEIVLLASDLVRVTWDLANGAPPPIPYAIARADDAWDPVTFAWEEGPGGCILRTADLELQVDKDDGAIRLYDHQARLLRNESPPTWRGQEIQHKLHLAAEEHFYGLGERAAAFNLRGGSYRLWNRDPNGAYGPGDDPLYVNIPVYLSLHDGGSHLVFYENSWPATFDLGKSFPEEAQLSFAGGQLRYYLIPGPPDRALERYTALTGRPSLPPVWALGYHQSRYSYVPEERFRRLAADFERHDLPVDVFHMDIDYMQDFRVFTWDQRKFPDLPGLVGQLGEQGIRLVAILDPGVKRDPGWDVFQDGNEQGVFCRLPSGEPVAAPVWPGWSVFPDFTDPKARVWWGKQYPRLLDAGVAGFWHDMNEPAAFTAGGDMTLPLPTRHELEGRGGDHREAHNVYGLLMAKAGFEGLRRLQPDKRPFILSRSGWAGLQRYAWNWTGDIRSDEASLRQVAPIVLGLGISGIPFTGHDVGGFSGKPTPEGFIRSLQLGTFLPFFRNHTGKDTPDQEPWAFGEPYLGIAREFLRLRYALLPYLYTLAWEAHTRGWPPIRPLFWNTPADRRLWDVGDAFLLGDSLLIAPAVTEDDRKRTVELPEGGWYNFWDGSLRQGPGRAELDMPLERIPVLVRAGRVLPMEPPAKSTSRREHERLLLHIYPLLGNGMETSVLYSDAGEGFGAGRIDRFRLRREGDRLELLWKGEGDYPFPYADVDVVMQGPSKMKRVWVDGQKREHDAGHIRGIGKQGFGRVEMELKG